MGGFPDQMLMEDVELSMRLKGQGSVTHIPNGVIVSQRRWEEVGFVKNIRLILTFLLQYLIERRLGLGTGTGEKYFQRYYAADSQPPLVKNG